MARSFTDNGTTTSYVGKSTAVATGVPISISCFIKSSSLTNFPVIVQIDDGSNTNFVDLAIDGNGAVYAQSHAAGGGVNAKSVVTVSNGTWFHVGAIFASTTSRSVYVNGGGKVTNTTSSTPATFTRSTIGGDRVLTDGFNGSICWLGIWNVALSDQDMSCLGANNIHPLNIRPQSLVACVDLIGTSPELDRVSGTGWTVGGSGTTAYADGFLVYLPRSRWQSAPISLNRTFGGSVTAKVSSSTAPLTISRPFVGTVTAKVTGTGSLTVPSLYGGSTLAKVSASGSFTRGILPPPTQNQTLRISGSGSFTVLHPGPKLIAPSTGYYVFLENDGAYLSDLLTGGLDYSFRIQSIISGPYPDSGTAFQALWTFLNLPFPFANPLPPPPPGQWTNR